jgi:hypothetical protein
MSSHAQIAANRINGRKSRGPRTAAGKWHASRNALRHGLTAISRYNSVHLPEIERIARAYCEGNSDPLLFEQALIIAENDVIIIRVEAECLAVVARMRDRDAIPFSDRKASRVRARARFEELKNRYDYLVQARVDAFLSGNSAGSNGNADNSIERKRSAGATGEYATACNMAASHSIHASKQPLPPAQYDEFEAVYRAAPDLVRLDRYRRRATSRRNRAMREFSFLRSLREFHRQAARAGQHDQAYRHPSELNPVSELAGARMDIHQDSRSISDGAS